MMNRIKSGFLSNGLAVFSMFFGAGNITFPLIVGRDVEGGVTLALLGLMFTAVLVPFTGLVAVVLFKGDYQSFFDRIGKIPAFILILLLIGLLGPLGGIPRLFALTFSTLKIYVLNLHFPSFTLIGCLLMFFFCYKKNRTLDVIGYVLSPVLLFFLFLIIVKGAFFTPDRILEDSRVSSPFFYGLKEGYNTMDLIAAFFFASLAYKRLEARSKDEKRRPLVPVLKASSIGSALLGIIYIGFGYVAAKYSHALKDVPAGQIVGKLGHLVLGHHAGLVVGLSVVLTCLTTAIALTIISADFFQKKMCKNKINYEISLAVVLALTALFSCLDFQGIVRLLAPVLQVIYPSLLMLCLFNILHKTFAFKAIKIPVFTTMFFALFFQYLVY